MSNFMILYLMPLNDGKQMQYVEDFIGDFPYLNKRLYTMIEGLETVWPDKSFSIKITDTENHVWFFKAGTYYDRNFNKIIASTQSLLN